MRHFFFGLAVFALAAPMPLWAETTDREIAQHIIRHLKSQKKSGDLKGFNLDLQVENGTVYLKGFVSEREQRRSAVEAARHVEGVKQVFNEIEIRQPNAPAAKPRDPVTTENSLDTPPQSPQVAIEMTPEDEKPKLATEDPDREIAQHIIRHLESQKKSGALKGFNLDLQVENGTVYLKGFVSEREQRRSAVEAARHVEGVKQVFNEIEIRQPNAPAAKPRDPVTTENSLDTPPQPPQVAIEMTPEDEKPKLATEDRNTEFSAEAVVSAPVLTNPVETSFRLPTPDVTKPNLTTPVLQEPILSDAPINVSRTPRPIEVVAEAVVRVPVLTNPVETSFRLPTPDVTKPNLTTPVLQEPILSDAPINVSRTPRPIEVVAEAVVRVPVLTNPVETSFRLPTPDVTKPNLTTPVLQEPILSDAPINVFRTPRPIEVVNEQPIGKIEPAHVGNAREITEAIVGQYRTAMASGDMQGFGIDVQVKEGVVWLKGTVSNQTQLDYAIDVARDVRGVTKIVNALGITPSHESIFVSHVGSDPGVQHAFRQESNPRASYAESDLIAKKVIVGLQKKKHEGLLTNFGIDVQVDQRTVWMSGHVKNSEQHALALDVARYIPGVEMVVNDLKIKGPVANALPQQRMIAQQAFGQQLANYQMVPVQYVPVQAMQASNQSPMAFAPARPVNHTLMQQGQPVPMTGNAGFGIAPARFDHPQMPGYAWPSYAPSPNYGAVTYPKQYSPSAWPYIGPFYPYPQVPLGWRRVTLEWDDGWWNLKFKNTGMH